VPSEYSRSGSTAERFLLGEAARLLECLELTPDAGSTRATDAVRVSIFPEHTDDGRWSVYVGCYAYGHQAVDWSRLRVALVEQAAGAGQTVFVLPPLTARGSAETLNASPGSYRVRVYRRPARLYPPPEPAVRKRRGRAGGIPVRILGTAQPPPSIVLFQSDEITVTAMPALPGVRLTCETTRNELQGATVELVLLRAEGNDILASGETRLDVAWTDSVTAAKSWRGEWQSERTVEGALEVIHRIVRPDA
jgi:hypothetical protein